MPVWYCEKDKITFNTPSRGSAACPICHTKKHTKMIGARRKSLVLINKSAEELFLKRLGNRIVPEFYIPPHTLKEMKEMKTIERNLIFPYDYVSAVLRNGD